MSGDNYYKVGGSLEYQHPTYVRRQADLALYEGLTNGEFCYVLNSRQMGKSSLRVQMMKKLKEQGFKCASVDMTRIGSHVTPSEWYAGLVSELLRGFSLSRKVNFSTWWRDREMLPPLQRLRELIEDVLLAEFSSHLVIFIDEIDSIIKIPFKEDFFAFIRACYNQRVDNPEYNRLTFCLLGVATPSDLITDKNISTPFNIGRAIELTGFELHEVQPLIQGLEGKVSKPEVVLREVLEWTGGQPFLTQKLCKLILSWEKSIAQGKEAECVEELVCSQTIENWETQDEPEHLRTIRDRILWSQRKGKLLQLYQQILQTGEIKANDTPEHMELRLSGLVVKQQGKLRVYNRIYASVFNQSWVENALAEAGLMPEVAETPAHPGAEIQALEQAGITALRLFESRQIVALLSAMKVGLALKALVSDGRPLRDYPVISPLYALQTILNNIRERNQFKTHQGPVYDVCFSPSGQCLATAGDDGTIKLWNLLGQQLAGWKGHLGIVYDVCFSPNGQLLATAGRDGTARLWNLSGQQIAQFDGHSGWVYSVSFSPDGQLLATAGAGLTVRLWNLSGQQIAQFDGHHKEVWSVSFSPDGQFLATAGRDSTARLWNLSGQQIAQFDGHQGTVWSVSFSPNGQFLATAGADGTARLWNLSGQQLAQLEGHQNWVRSVSFNPDGQYLATAGYDGTARLWNLSGQQLAQFKGHIGAVLGLSFSPDEQRLVTVGGDGKARLWDLSEKHLPQLKGHQGKVWSVSFSPNGQFLATASSDGTARLWDLSGQQLAQMDGHQGSVWTVSFSPDGQYLVTTGSDRTARLWNLAGQQQAKLDAHQGWVTRVTFSPDGQRLATVGREGTAKLWDLSGQLISQVIPHQGWVWSVSFSPDGQLVATVGSDATPPLLDSSGRFIVQLKGYQGKVGSISFSPDGQYLATASLEDGTAQLWNLFGQQLAELDGQQGWVICVSFSSDGQLVATAGEDGSVCLWDLAGRQVSRFNGNQGAIYGMSFSPDGQCLATAGKDDPVRLWRVEGLDELLARGCDWLQDYFVTHPEELEKLKVCQNRFKSIEAGRNLAKLDDIEGALSNAIPSAPQDDVQEIAQLTQAPELPSASDSSSKAEVRKLAAKSLVAVLGEMLTRQGDIEKAVAAYAEAQKLDPTIEIPAIVGNNLCRWGSLWGHAADVMDACETAVALEPENGKFRDSRGLARVLTGNIAGAIEDFQVFVNWTDNEEKRLKRQRWLEALRAGENPFTEEEMESLFNEYNVAHPQELEELEVYQNQITSVEVGRNLEEVGDVEGESAKFHESAQTSNLTSKRILWVDDNPANIACEIATVQEKGIEVTQALSTSQAVQILVSSGLSFNAIITDMGRTEEGEYRPKAGISLIKAVREAGINLPILVYTTLNLYGRTINEVVAAGGNGATMSAEELFAWLRDYINPVRASDIEGALSEAIPLVKEDAQASKRIAKPQQASEPAPAPPTVARERLVTTMSNEPGEGFLGEFFICEKAVRIYQGDITNLVTHAIVSSDDNYLTMSGGVSYRIRQVGGDEIYREARNLTPLSLGEVGVTTAGKLRAKKIFHAVVIDFEDREGLSEEVIQRVVHTCMKKANIYGFSSIAFPLLGTGAGAFPVKHAWEILLGQIIKDLSDKNQGIIEVIIVLYKTTFIEELKIKDFLETIEEFGWKSLM